MKKGLNAFAAVLLTGAVALAGEATEAIHGTVTKVDDGAKTLAVKTADGTQRTVHIVSKTVVHGTDAGAKDTFKGVKEGSDVVVRYTKSGSNYTATEVDHVGKDGLKASEGTVYKIDQKSKTIAVKSADGTVQTFKVAGNDISRGAEKSGKVTVYYTEEAGKKVAHFFENH